MVAHAVVEVKRTLLKTTSVNNGNKFVGILTFGRQVCGLSLTKLHVGVVYKLKYPIPIVSVGIIDFPTKSI